MSRYGFNQTNIAFNLIVVLRIVKDNYFSLNLSNPAVKNIISLVKQTIGIEVILKKRLRKLDQIDFAFIFGSYAKNSFKADSDIDLYVIGNIKEDDLHREISVVENNINHPINYHLSSLTEFKEQARKNFFHKNILEKYILLIGNQDEFKNLAK
jgi:predicted nucleotidyltransferase